MQALATRLARSPLERHSYFAALTLFTIVFVGYHFGTFDQVTHIPFLKKYADPTLFPGEEFIELRNQHYSYFWFLFLPFYKVGLLEIAMFAAHLLATYASFWALWTLSETLFHNPLSHLLGTLAFAIPHIGYGGWIVFEFSLLNRTFVFPFLVVAIILFLRRRQIAAFAVLGVMYNLHVISVNFVLGMFLFDCLLEWKKIGLRNIAVGLSLFVIASLPVILWKLSGPPTNFSIRPDWLALVAQSSHFNLFYLISPSPMILLATASGTGALMLFFIARRYAPASEHDGTVANFVYALVLVLVFQIITSQWLPIVIVIESQIIRAGVFTLVFACLYFANYLAWRYASSESATLDLHLLTGATIFSIVGFVPPLVWAAQRWLESQRTLKSASVGLLAIGVPLGAYVFAAQAALWYPGIYIYPHQTAWYDAQIWARDHTPKEAIFITPPDQWWVYESDWRVFSERSIVVCYSDLLEASVILEYIDIWKTRFEAIAPGAIRRFHGNVIENLQIAGESYARLSDEDLTRIARQYGATYVVVEKSRPRNWKPLYENAQFIIYQLPPQWASLLAR